MSEREFSFSRRGIADEHEKGNAAALLRIVRREDGTQEIQWSLAGFGRIPEIAVLQQSVSRQVLEEACRDERAIPLKGALFPKGLLRNVLKQKEIAGSPQGQECGEQRSIEFDDALCELSQHLALGGKEGTWKLFIESRAYLRPAWAARTNASACSSWPRWDTPNTMNEAPNSGSNRKAQIAGLGNQAKAWPTADANSSTYSNGERGMNLREAAGQWPTCRGSDGEKGGPNQAGSKGDLMLPSSAANWPSPTARIVKGGGSAMNRKDGKSRMDMLDWAAENYSPQAPPTNAGPTSSPDGPTSRPRLNPAFTFWLMGMPWWWGNPEQISFAQREMESFRSKLRQQLSACCGGSE